MIELKPCPFCGNSAESFIRGLAYAGNAAIYAECKCTCCGTRKYAGIDLGEDITFNDFISKLETVAAEWNHRAGEIGEDADGKH